jgi:hypothetical protein
VYIFLSLYLSRLGITMNLDSSENPSESSPATRELWVREEEPTLQLPRDELVVRRGEKRTFKFNLALFKTTRGRKSKWARVRECLPAARPRYLVSWCSRACSSRIWQKQKIKTKSVLRLISYISYSRRYFYLSFEISWPHDDSVTNVKVFN